MIEYKIIIQKEKEFLETFGQVKEKWKKSTQKIKDEIKEELHHI